MTKTLTEKWHDGTLERGYYYYKTKAGAKVIGFQCYGFKYPYDYNHNTIDSVEEVLAPFPSYEELREKEVIYNTTSRCNETLLWENESLKNKVGKLKEQLADASKTIARLQEQLKEANEVIKTFYWKDRGESSSYIKKWGVK